MHEGGVIAGFYGIGMYCNITRLENKGGLLEYWGGGGINVTTFTQFGQNWSIGCLLALYCFLLSEWHRNRSSRPGGCQTNV